ncbi:MAG: hypothetical protein HYZ53_21695 [Planctomycetes bacterium]|nr:hypothetical protein [Planctomycetota bacterium]
MATIAEKIITIALEQLKKHPDGIRYTDLVSLVQATDPSLNKNTIHGTVWDLAIRLPDKVYKPSRGLFRLVEFREKDTDQLKAALVPKPAKKTKEEDFYSSFADWLVNDLEDCTKAIPLGGNRFRDRWGTPDVVGKRESKKSDILQAPGERTRRCTLQIVRLFARYAGMIERPFWLGRLKRGWAQAPIVWLSGVRHSGKTTLAKSLAPAELTCVNCELPSSRTWSVIPPSSFAGAGTPRWSSTKSSSSRTLRGS